MRGRSVASLGALLAFAMPVHAIPPPPPPPDPVVMAEADKLAEALVALDDGDLRLRARSALSREAFNWLVNVHPDVREPAVHRAFVDVVYARADAIWPEEQVNIRAGLVSQFRLMTATDLIAVRSFIASPAGQNFGRILVDSYFGLADRTASEVLYRRLFPELPGLLDTAQKRAAE